MPFPTRLYVFVYEASVKADRETSVRNFVLVPCRERYQVGGECHLTGRRLSLCALFHLAGVRLVQSSDLSVGSLKLPFPRLEATYILDRRLEGI